MKKIIYAMLILISFLIAGCVETGQFEDKEGNTLEEECETDSECIISGCNSEICAKEKMMSICIYKPEFECYKLTECKCINGKCGWEQTEKFSSCLEHNKLGEEA